MKNEFYYPSRDGVTQIHAQEWIPEGEVKAVVQICHGMVEYIDRYDEFARYLNQYGYYVTGQDHLGHGKSINKEEDYGYFPETKGNQFVIGDIHKIRQQVMKKYPSVPYFMLGHSMGSFLLRQYLTMYGKGLAGAVIMGTGQQGFAALCMGQAVCRLLAAFRGWRYRSLLVTGMAFGGYNKRFRADAEGTGKGWITSDAKRRREYVEDPLCSFRFTLAAYYQMFEGMKVLNHKESMARIPKKLPVLFVAGAEDPVGNYGKNVRRVYGKYRAAGIEDVKIKLYEGDRHELLNETDRQKVSEDIHRWLEREMCRYK